MIPYDESYFGTNRVVYSDGRVDTWQALRHRRVLSNVSSVNGDHKSPNPHSYVKWHDDYVYGSAVTTTRRYPDSTYTTPYAIEVVTETGWNSNFPLPTVAAQVSSPYNDALEQFYSRIKGSDLNLAVDVAERRQLYRMLSDLYLSTRRIKKTIRRIAQGKLAFVGNSWLAYQYGIRPTISTAYGLLKWSYRNAQRKVSVSARSTKVSEGQGIVPVYGENWVVKSKRSSRVLIKAQFSIGDETLFNASRLTSLNPLAIAWELVPYSFVVDWFLDVGSYLQSFEASFLNGISFHSGFRTDTYLHESSCEFSKHVDDVSAGYLSRMSQTINRRGGFRYASLTRTKLSSLPRPDLPTIEVNLGSQRLLSAAALLRQVGSR